MEDISRKFDFSQTSCPGVNCQSKVQGPHQSPWVIFVENPSKFDGGLSLMIYRCLSLMIYRCFLGCKLMSRKDENALLLATIVSFEK